MDKHTQEARILAALNIDTVITPWMALMNFGCMRLGARIYDLRRKGHKIQMRLTVSLSTGSRKHVAAYWIDKKDRKK